MSNVPPEIHLEVLKFLPVESLLRFRSVCKAWCDIIDDSTFAKKQIHRGIGGQWFFHRHYNGKIFLSSINEMIKKRSSIMHATNVKTFGGGGVPRMPEFPAPSCNGLILLPSCNLNFLWRIWNPFTGESLELGQCTEFPDLNGQYFNHPCSGIGYDEANDDYKVVSIVFSNTYLYSVNLKVWRKIGEFSNTLIGHNNGVFADGALHWIAYSLMRNGDWGWIVALDLSTEIYRKIALPSEVIQDARLRLDLDALSECLFLSCSDIKGQHCDVWMLKNYGCEDTWIKIISLENAKRIKPLAYLKSKGRVLLHRHEWEYLWYDVEKSAAEKLSIVITADGIDKEVEWYKYSSQVFHASLIRLNKTDDKDETVALEETSKEDETVAEEVTSKGDETVATTERLLLKVYFGDAEDSPSDEVPVCSNASAIN